MQSLLTKNIGDLTSDVGNQEVPLKTCSNSIRSPIDWPLYIENQLKIYGRISVDVKGDGNCQFRALAYQMNLGEESYRTVRTKVVTEMRENPDRYKELVIQKHGNWDDYLKTHELPSEEWGDHVTLQAAANAYNRKIKVIQNAIDVLTLVPEDGMTRESEELWLAFLPEVHYRGTKLIEDPIPN